MPTRCPLMRQYRMELGCPSPLRQAGQFSRTQGLCRRLSEPSAAGHSAVLCSRSQRSTSMGNSALGGTLYVFHEAYMRVKKKMQKTYRIRYVTSFATETSYHPARPA